MFKLFTETYKELPIDNVHCMTADKILIENEEDYNLCCALADQYNCLMPSDNHTCEEAVAARIFVWGEDSCYHSRENYWMTLNELDDCIEEKTILLEEEKIRNC